MPPAPLSAAGPLALCLFALAVAGLFRPAVMDVVPPVLTGAPIFVSLLPGSGPVPVAVVAAGLERSRRGGVSGSLCLFWHAGIVMVVLVAGRTWSVQRLNNQGPVQVGLHVGPDVEAILQLQLAVERLAAGLVLPPQLVGPLLPH